MQPILRDKGLIPKCPFDIIRDSLRDTLKGQLKGRFKGKLRNEQGSIDRIQKELLNKCNLIEPRYLPVVEPAEYDGKDILVIWTPGGDDRPYI